MFAAWCSGGVLCMVAESLRPDRVALARFLSEMAIEKMILPDRDAATIGGRVSPSKALD